MHTPTAAAPPRHPRLTLAATILGSSLAFVDGSVVNVALPDIGRALHADTAALQWTINAYLLPLSALLLFGGAAGDHYGRRRVFLWGIVIFALASLACALAPGQPVLLAARGLQGLGAALLMPNSLAILGAAFSDEARGRAIGTWAAVGAIAAAVGPPLGGWLVQVAGWRSIFLLNLPLALGAWWLGHRYVDESSDPGRPLDVVGALLATLALGALTWALTLWSGSGLSGSTVLAPLLTGVVLLVAFSLFEARLGDRAMMPRRLFASRAFVGLTALTFLLYGALGGLLVLLPYFLIEAAHYTPLQAGLAFLPFSIILGLGSRSMGRLAERMGPRWPLTLGPLVAGLGLLLFLRISADASYWTAAFPAMVVMALGMAGAVAPLTTAVLSSVDRQHTGTASGFNSAVARTGGLIATALCGAVIGQQGPELARAFHAAALLGAGCAFLSALVAFATLSSVRTAAA
ncbi:MFS transporter [Xylophilus sp. GOD-11R]|uniref:MFS transporter n=1 Tax=Xylophilus sp. GOD-11R TaxID=3089814 RepID=UPI00298D3742|nr:MFS transporter [Xylophilus sp. GOD-11R]WPB58350.1 MFS transporter [Xylophilus sp. GOD-11R]